MARRPDVKAWVVSANLAESGSFTPTATSLGVSKATVSNAIMRLETRIGTSLLK